ncbi:hypothetical protein KCU83_g4062, partial [Aureobasidium melanogenum]
MATFFYNITEAFTALAISEASAQNTNNEPIINPNFPDYSTSTYDLQGRDIRFQPEPTGPMRPNFIPYGPSTEMIGRFYPSGTSAPVYSLDKVRKLESAGYLRSQVTVGRWRACAMFALRIVLKASGKRNVKSTCKPSRPPLRLGS